MQISLIGTKNLFSGPKIILAKLLILVCEIFLNDFLLSLYFTRYTPKNSVKHSMKSS